MKRIWPGGIVTVFLLSLPVSPGQAQRRADQGQRQFAEVFGTGASALFPDHASGIAVSRAPIVEKDGSESVRRTIVGSLPLASNVNVGIGLFSVHGARVKERDFKRARPMDDVFVKPKTVAAVGLSLRF